MIGVTICDIGNRVRQVGDDGARCNGDAVFITISVLHKYIDNRNRA